MKHLETVTSIRVFWLLRALRRLLREKKGKDRLKIWKFHRLTFWRINPNATGPLCRNKGSAQVCGTLQKNSV